MIVNANLISLTTPPVSNGNGGFTAGTTTTFSNPVRCCVDQPNFVQQKQLEGNLKDVTAVMYVAKPLPGSLVPEAGSDVSVQQDNQTAIAMRVAKVMPREHRGQSHYEMFLQVR